MAKMWVENENLQQENEALRRRNNWNDENSALSHNICIEAELHGARGGHNDDKEKRKMLHELRHLTTKYEGMAKKIRGHFQLSNSLVASTTPTTLM